MKKIHPSAIIGPDVELADDPSWRDRLTIRGVDRLPLTTP